MSLSRTAVRTGHRGGRGHAGGGHAGQPRSRVRRPGPHRPARTRRHRWRVRGGHHRRATRPRGGAVRPGRPAPAQPPQAAGRHPVRHRLRHAAGEVPGRGAAQRECAARRRDDRTGRLREAIRGTPARRVHRGVAGRRAQSLVEWHARRCHRDRHRRRQGRRIRLPHRRGAGRRPRRRRDRELGVPGHSRQLRGHAPGHRARAGRRHRHPGRRLRPRRAGGTGRHACRQPLPDARDRARPRPRRLAHPGPAPWPLAQLVQRAHRRHLPARRPVAHRRQLHRRGRLQPRPRPESDALQPADPDGARRRGHAGRLAAHAGCQAGHGLQRRGQRGRRHRRSADREAAGAQERTALDQPHVRARLPGLRTGLQRGAVALRHRRHRPAALDVPGRDHQADPGQHQLGRWQGHQHQLHGTRHRRALRAAVPAADGGRQPESGAFAERHRHPGTRLRRLTRPDPPAGRTGVHGAPASDEHLLQRRHPSRRNR